MLTLPTDLHDAIVRALAAAPAQQWMRAAQELSERYRAPRADAPGALATSELHWLGYAAMILPASYAQLYGAMAATAARIRSWAPTSMLDIGSGPGTALWAAAAHWPSLSRLAAWEREPAAIALGRKLARDSASPAIRSALWERVDLRRPEPAGARRYDLVVLGHVLNELPADMRAAAVQLAWDLTGGLLLIVEPGTPAGFAVARAARDTLLASGAHTIAPCAHDRPCPLANDWCHFPQRIQRPEAQRRARGAPSPWEEGKFAYAALARFVQEAPIWGRVLREPVSNKAYAEVELSTAAGVARYRALKRHRDAFRLVKDLQWGAAITTPLPAPIEPQGASERAEDGEHERAGGVAPLGGEE